MIKITAFLAMNTALILAAPLSCVLPAFLRHCLTAGVWLVVLPAALIMLNAGLAGAASAALIFTMLQAGYLVYRSSVLSMERERKESLDALSNKKSDLASEIKRLSLEEDDIRRREHDIVNLYEITRKMSECLRFEDIFKSFGGIMRDSFSFARCDLVLVRWEDGQAGVGDKYTINLKARDGVQEKKWPNLDKILGLLIADPRAVFIEEDEDASSVIAAPLMSEKKMAGMLVVSGLPKADMERFLILAAQFALETKKVLLYEMVEKLAITDSLTGLYVRRYFSERIGEELQRSRRHRMGFAFLMLDIDNFKKCNDTYGHLVGDVILKELGRIMKESVREIDLVSRYGGEEFAIVLPETGPENAMAVAERLRKRVEGTVFRAYDEKLKITVSIGVSIYPGDADNLSGLIGKADSALYNAKKSGKNVVREYKKRYNDRL